jgi:hypothetical protein
MNKNQNLNDINDKNGGDNKNRGRWLLVLFSIGVVLAILALELLGK